MRAAAPRRATLEQSSNPAIELTFLEHLQELRARITWVAITVLAAGLAAFAMHDHIVNLLLLPLGHKDLVYLTPLSGVNFLIKLSLYVGILAAIPVIVYQLYRFLEPTASRRIGKAPRYIFMSVILAFAGIAFAYFVGLPAALKFLTNIGIANVNPMITVDSYLGFVTGYAFACAFLFQIPLIMSLINTVRPTPPSQLLKYERHVVVLTLIIAAVVSPTPDVAGQLLMGAPIFIMWHIGLFIMWRQDRKRQKTMVRASAATAQSGSILTPEPPVTLRATANVPAHVSPAKLQPAAMTVPRIASPQPRRVVMDMVAPVTKKETSARPAERVIVMPQRRQRTQRRPASPGRSMDGMTRPPRLVRDIQPIGYM